MYACKFFPNQKQQIISRLLDKILSEVDLDTTNTPCTTDKGSNMLAATTAKCCACHRLSTSINTAWEAATEECDELAALGTNSNSLVKKCWEY